MAIRLNERDMQILSHLRRYRLSTIEVLHGLFFPDTREDAVKSTLKRLKGENYVASQKLFPRGNEVYYHLAPAAVPALGISPASSLKPSEKYVFEAYAQLLFCCTGDAHRPRFSQDEFEECFPGFINQAPDFANRFQYDAYYLDIDEHGMRRLGRILVDRGDSNLFNLFTRAVDVADRAYPQFLAEYRFTLAFIFPNDGRKRKADNLIRSTLRNDRYHVRLVTTAFPSLHRFLGDLVAPPASPTRSVG
ncbi:MAG: hypothetical protein HY270_05545 [Deltaproteobacteria bacterium]|nr:hypothetical protein [Deltaproteobacteria bacterium]